jgi:hypothetical protein
MSDFNFKIRSKKIISECFKEAGIHDFYEACSYITSLPYKRNEDKNDLTTVFSDGFGTCSTKHAVLKQLAMEHKKDEVKLMLGIVKMSGVNTPAVRSTLEKNGLTYIPEAHNYLFVNGARIDCTKKNFVVTENDIFLQTEIQPEMITEFKVGYHQRFLLKWLNENPTIKLSFEDLWKVREECIKDLYN